MPQCNESMYNQDQKTKRCDKDIVKRLYWIKGNRVEMSFKIWFKNGYRGGQFNMQWQAVSGQQQQMPYLLYICVYFIYFYYKLGSLYKTINNKWNNIRQITDILLYT